MVEDRLWFFIYLFFELGLTVSFGFVRREQNALKNSCVFLCLSSSFFFQSVLYVLVDVDPFCFVFASVFTVQGICKAAEVLEKYGDGNQLPLIVFMTDGTFLRQSPSLSVLPLLLPFFLSLSLVFVISFSLCPLLFVPLLYSFGFLFVSCRLI